MWTKVPLKDLFNVRSSKRVLKSQWRKTGIPFYRGREITKLSKAGFVDNELFISEELYSNFKESYGVPKSDDIMITAIGTIGNSYIVRQEDQFYFKDASVLWLQKTSEVDSTYINLWLSSSRMRDQLEKGNGATVDTLTIQKLQNLIVDLPPLEEQKRIVAILTQIFANIEKARATAEKNLQNVRELFYVSLEKKVNNESYTYFSGHLLDCCSIKSKLVDPREGDYIKLLHVGAGNMISESGELIDVKTAREDKLISGKFLFDESMILYSKIRPYLKKVCRPDFTGLCSADVYPLSPDNNKLDKGYLYYLLLSQKFTDYAIAGSGRAGMPKVNRSHLFKYPVNLPNLARQKECVRSLDELAKKTALLQNLYNKKTKIFDELKKSILQQAFNGKLTTGKGAIA